MRHRRHVIKFNDAKSVFCTRFFLDDVGNDCDQHQKLYKPKGSQHNSTPTIMASNPDLDPYTSKAESTDITPQHKIDGSYVCSIRSTLNLSLSAY